MFNISKITSSEQIQTSSHHSDTVSQLPSRCVIAASPGNQTSNALPDFELCVRLRSASRVFNHLLAEASLRPALVSPPRCKNSSVVQKNRRAPTSSSQPAGDESNGAPFDGALVALVMLRLQLPAATCGCLPSIKQKMDQLDPKKRRQKPNFSWRHFLMSYICLCHTWGKCYRKVFQEPEPCVCLQSSAVPIIVQK